MADFSSCSNPFHYSVVVTQSLRIWLILSSFLFVYLSIPVVSFFNDETNIGRFFRDVVGNYWTEEDEASTMFFHRSLSSSSFFCHFYMAFQIIDVYLLSFLHHFTIVFCSISFHLFFFFSNIMLPYSAVFLLELVVDVFVVLCVASATHLQYYS